MKLIDKHGNKMNLPDETIPDEMKEWLYTSVQMVPDDAKLEKCWVASLCAAHFPNYNQYEYVAEEIYDHYPTEEEIMWLMAKNDVLRFSYVEVAECYRLHETYD